MMLYRYLRDYKRITPDIKGELDVFPDRVNISPYEGFTEAMSWAVGSDIISGKNEYGVIKLAPSATATRSEAAAMLARFCMGLK